MRKVNRKLQKVNRKLHPKRERSTESYTHPQKKPKGHIDSNHVTFYDGHTLFKHVTLVIECLN